MTLLYLNRSLSTPRTSTMQSNLRPKHQTGVPADTVLTAIYTPETKL